MATTYRIHVHRANTYIQPTSKVTRAGRFACLMMALVIGLDGCTSASRQASNGAEKSLLPQPHLTSDEFIISVVGTNDVHGQLLSQRGRGGIETLSGYVANLRQARADDGGAVLLIDAGDMWQGTLESNLSEGAAMLSVYNALGYTAAAIGNHEFDFGPVGVLATPSSDADDPRGALKQRANEANFPLLAANLIDNATNAPVNWPNVRPSVLVSVNNVKVGIIGVMTIEALSATISANTTGLRVAPLASSIIDQAKALKSHGAHIVIVAAHAGGNCEQFDNPFDLSSCDQNAEIMQVARDLPTHLVDHIIAGHRHRGIAHIVNGIAITSNFGSARTFGRVDFTLNKSQMKVTGKRVFPPQIACPGFNRATGDCVWTPLDNSDLEVALYENNPVVPSANVSDIVARAKAQAMQLKQQQIGIYLDTPVTNKNKPESALGNLFLTALLATSGADVAIHNVTGGLRADLPNGYLTYGDVYQMFPFDNRIVMLQITGLDLRRIIEHQALKKDRRAGFAGFRSFVTCDNQQMDIRLVLDNGREVRDSDILELAVNDFIAYGGDDILTPIIPSEGLQFADDTPLARDQFVQWLTKLGADQRRPTAGRISEKQFNSTAMPQWNMAEPISTNCSL